MLVAVVRSQLFHLVVCRGGDDDDDDGDGDGGGVYGVVLLFGFPHFFR